MGWSKRGNGRNYDSLNDYGCVIGFLSSKLLDYETHNRKYLLCDLVHKKEDHDCRLNFQGSAKAMEPAVGASLAYDSKVLEKSDLRVRVLIGYKDNATISAVRKGTTQTVFKLSDKNHLHKSFNSDLYGLRTKYNEMKKKGVFQHIKKCLTYAIAQNKGKSAELAAAMLSIPGHLFNEHESCNSWCHHGDENSRKQTVLLKNQNLYTALKDIFTKYAKNSQKFCVSTSSQSNESISNITAHKFPKNRCYSRNEFADYRSASAICTTNEGDSHVMSVNEKLQLSPGKYTEFFTRQLDKTRKKRAIKSILPSTRGRRIILGQKRGELRQKDEKSEGIQSNCGFSNEHTMSNEGLDFQASYVDFSDIVISLENSIIVYFDLETSGFHKNYKILQIAAQYRNYEFSVYVTPTKEINPEASQHTGLKNINGQLYLRHDKVLTISLKDAILAFQQFLSLLKKPCLLVAHNASFDTSHSIRAISNCNMVNDFKVIAGFCGSLPLFKKHFTKRTGEGTFKLESLAGDFLKEESNGASHEALSEVHVLKSLASSYLHSKDIFSRAKSFSDSINHVINLKKINVVLPFLQPLKTILKDGLLRKMTIQGLTYELLQKKYDEEGEEGLVYILTLLKNGKPQVTKNKRIIAQIVNWFKSKNNCN